MKTKASKIPAIWSLVPANVVLHLLYVKLDCLVPALTHETLDHELFLIQAPTPALWTPSSTRRNLMSVETPLTNQASREHAPEN